MCFKNALNFPVLLENIWTERAFKRHQAIQVHVELVCII